MPDRYIDFAKVGESRVVDAVRAEKYAEIKEEIERQKIDNIGLREALKEQREEIERMKKIFNAVKLESKT